MTFRVRAGVTVRIGLTVRENALIYNVNGRMGEWIMDNGILHSRGLRCGKMDSGLMGQGLGVKIYYDG